MGDGLLRRPPTGKAALPHPAFQFVVSAAFQFLGAGSAIVLWASPVLLRLATSADRNEFTVFPRLGIVVADCSFISSYPPKVTAAEKHL